MKKPVKRLKVRRVKSFSPFTLHPSTFNQKGEEK
jgi:hypothetical protein